MTMTFMHCILKGRFTLQPIRNSDLYFRIPKSKSVLEIRTLANYSERLNKKAEERRDNKFEFKIELNLRGDVCGGANDISTEE